MNLFIDRGCNINVQDLSSNTALHYACIYSHLNIIKALLSSKDININLKNIENKTALQAAVPNDFEIFLIFDNFLKMKKLDQNDKNQNISEKNQDKENNFKKREIIGPNNFVAISLLGKGSFAEVYLVEKKDDKKLFAMKVLHKNKILSIFFKLKL